MNRTALQLAILVSTTSLLFVMFLTAKAVKGDIVKEVLGGVVSGISICFSIAALNSKER